MSREKTPAGLKKKCKNVFNRVRAGSAAIVEYWLFFCPTTQCLFTKELIPAGKFFNSSQKIKSSPKN